MTDWSLIEVEALSKKAAKGAGYSWGQAEDAARAVRWLEARGLEGAAALAAVLEQKDAGLADTACPILRGISVSDGMSPASELAGDSEIVSPILLLPFADWAGESLDLGVEVGPEEVRSHTSGDTMKALGAFAHRTYAPATEESRVQGAGAGLTDND